MNRHFNKLTFNCCDNILGEKKIVWCKEKIQLVNEIIQLGAFNCFEEFTRRVTSELVVACKGFLNFKEVLKGCIHNWGT